jgi:hypothetical protein
MNGWNARGRYSQRVHLNSKHALFTMQKTV